MNRGFYTRWYVSILIGICSIILAGCHSSKKTSQSANESKKSKQAFYAEYSRKLGVTVDEQSNEKLVRVVGDWLGTPHKDGACTKDGTDCSGFVLNVYKDAYGITLRRTSGEQFADCNSVKLYECKEGDLVFFKLSGSKISHVGIYLRDNKFAHASSSKGVMISSLDEPYWKKCFYAAGRVKK